MLFLVANSAKIVHGGWLPPPSARSCSSLQYLEARPRPGHYERDRAGLRLEPFLQALSIDPPQRVEHAVFMSGGIDEVPHAAA
jgi:K+ transporter